MRPSQNLVDLTGATSTLTTEPPEGPWRDRAIRAASGGGPVNGQSSQWPGWPPSSLAQRTYRSPALAQLLQDRKPWRSCRSRRS